MNNDNLNNIKQSKHMNLILHNETSNSKKEGWCKLGKTEKIVKFNSYVDKLSQNNNLNDTNSETLKRYLIESLDRKRLTSVKDVIYDKENGVIKDIPLLFFNSNTNRYTLKRNEKKNSTIKSLPTTNKLRLKKRKKDKDKDKN
tara:strand:- start:856 stop:1284 length:429 start_codon:yes stop_codon:yes gene_type:complete